MSGTLCGRLRDAPTCGVGSEGGTLGGIYTEGIYPMSRRSRREGQTLDGSESIVPNHQTDGGNRMFERTINLPGWASAVLVICTFYGAISLGVEIGMLIARMAAR